MKRVLYAILAAAMLFTVIGCTGASDENFDVDFDSIDPSSVSLDGMTINFTVALDSSEGLATSQNTLGYLYGTPFSDLALEKIADTEKKLNFKLNVKYEDFWAFADKFALSASVGDNSCDAMLTTSFHMYDWASAGLLVGISTLGDYIDYRDSEKWGTPSLLEVMFYKDDLYGLIPAAWPELVYSSFGYPLVANMDLLYSVGGDDPREFVENKNWTWDIFNNQLEKCTVVVGNETRPYGLVTHYPYMAEMILRSNGASFAEIDANGNYICGYLTDAARRAAEEIRLIYQGDLAYTVSKTHAGSSLDTAYDFLDGVGVYSFLPTQYIFGVYGYVSMEIENYAILPTPIGPDVNADHSGGIYHAMSYTLAFPSMSDNITEAAMVVNELYSPLPGYETLDDVKAYMRNNYFFDDRDADAFFDLFFNSRYNYYYTSGASARTIPEVICTSNEAISTLLEKHSTTMQSLFDSRVNNCLDGYKLFN